MDDDAELRDLIIHNLEQKGIIQKMRAQIRSHIYHLIDEEISTESSPKDKHNKSIGISGQQSTDKSKNDSESSGSSAIDESIALSLVQDLLECYNLTYTSSILKSELTNKLHGKNWSRGQISEILQLDDGLSGTPTEQDYSSDTFNGNGSDATNANQSADGNNTTSGCDKMQLPKTPLLVEILRRLPKTTDIAQTSTTSGNDSDVNNETFVTNSRSNSGNTPDETKNPIGEENA